MKHVSGTLRLDLAALSRAAGLHAVRFRPGQGHAGSAEPRRSHDRASEAGSLRADGRSRTRPSPSTLAATATWTISRLRTSCASAPSCVELHAAPPSLRSSRVSAEGRSKLTDDDRGQTLTLLSRRSRVSSRHRRKVGKACPTFTTLERRINSVSSTKQITRTMEMVAAAKIRRASVSCGELLLPWSTSLMKRYGNAAARVRSHRRRTSAASSISEVKRSVVRGCRVRPRSGRWLQQQCSARSRQDHQGEGAAGHRGRGYLVRQEGYAAISSIRASSPCSSSAICPPTRLTTRRLVSPRIVSDGYVNRKVSTRSSWFSTMRRTTPSRR